jgi:hypothetical protein
MLNRCRVVALLSLFGIASAPVASAAAESLDTQQPAFGQIRSTDRRLADAIGLGLRRSATFRALVADINQSNVVVYITCGSQKLRSGLSGQLTFLSAAGGFRYVVVQVDSRLPRWRLIAMLGHELQHAREIAATAWIVDADSLAHAYRTQLGYTRGRGVFDSIAAVRAGEDILRELLRGTP